MKTPAQRKAAERARKREAGLVELRGVWIQETRKTEFLAAVRRLQKQFNEVTK